MGHAKDSAKGLKDLIGLENDKVLSILLKRGMDAVEEEFLTHGDKEDQANFEYVANAVALDPASLPNHVQEQIKTGRYHGGKLLPNEFDEGNKGKTLADFVMDPISVSAGLKDVHVLVLRLYTTSSFPCFNKPLRDRQKPHPFKMSVYYLDEALKKLRDHNTNQPDFTKVMWLYRGMKDMTVDTQTFLEKGGTELAMMSTTNKLDVAMSYAHSQTPLIFKYKTRGLGRGCSIKYLSVYPKEEEFVYPPLTFLQPEGDPKTENGITFLEVTPQMA